MGHEEEAPAETGQEILQPLDSVQVQMIRGLVQEEKVGLGGQGPAQEGSTFLPPGEGGERLVTVQMKEGAEALDGLVGLGSVVGGPDSDQGLDCTRQTRRNLLGKEGDPQTGALTMTPSSGSRVPARISRRVDFPSPFRPTSPIRSAPFDQQIRTIQKGALTE